MVSKESFSQRSKVLFCSVSKIKAFGGNSVRKVLVREAKFCSAVLVRSRLSAPPTNRRPKAKSGPLGWIGMPWVGYFAGYLPDVPVLEGESNKNFLAMSNFKRLTSNYLFQEGKKNAGEPNHNSSGEYLKMFCK
nr:hypothetical protein [Tanacetum cinerariifolium]